MKATDHTRCDALALAASCLASAAGCTFHAAIGGQGRVHGDDTIGDVKAPEGAPALTLGAGPCIRWPRLRASLTVDASLRGVSFIPFAAGEAMWIFDEGYARDDREGVSRTSLALKGRLAGGWNGITDRWIAEAAIGLAIVIDSERMRDLVFASDSNTGDFHAVSLDLVSTYAPDRDGEAEVWLGGQITFHLNALALPGSPGGTRFTRRGGGYGTPTPGESTDCNSGYLP